MCRHTASICAAELAVCRAHCCVTCRAVSQNVCERAGERPAGAYCDLICRAVCEGPLVFARSCLSAALLIMSLAARLMQQLIAAPSATRNSTRTWQRFTVPRVYGRSSAGIYLSSWRLFFLFRRQRNKSLQLLWFPFSRLYHNNTYIHIHIHNLILVWARREEF